MQSADQANTDDTSDTGLARRIAAGDQQAFVLPGGSGNGGQGRCGITGTTGVSSRNASETETRIAPPAAT